MSNSSLHCVLIVLPCHTGSIPYFNPRKSSWQRYSLHQRNKLRRMHWHRLQREVFGQLQLSSMSVKAINIGCWRIKWADGLHQKGGGQISHWSFLSLSKIVLCRDADSAFIVRACTRVTKNYPLIQAARHGNATQIAHFDSTPSKTFFALLLIDWPLDFNALASLESSAWCDWMQWHCRIAPCKLAPWL